MSRSGFSVNMKIAARYAKTPAVSTNYAILSLNSISTNQPTPPKPSISSISRHPPSVPPKDPSIFYAPYVPVYHAPYIPPMYKYKMRNPVIFTDDTGQDEFAHGPWQFRGSNVYGDCYEMIAIAGIINGQITRNIDDPRASIVFIIIGKRAKGAPRGPERFTFLTDGRQWWGWHASHCQITLTKMDLKLINMVIGGWMQKRGITDAT